jgi:hypothetical protein
MKVCDGALVPRFGQCRRFLNQSIGFMDYFVKLFGGIHSSKHGKRVPLRIGPGAKPNLLKAVFCEHPDATITIMKCAAQDIVCLITRQKAQCEYSRSSSLAISRIRQPTDRCRRVTLGDRFDECGGLLGFQELPVKRIQQRFATRRVVHV